MRVSNRSAAAETACATARMTLGRRRPHSRGISFSAGGRWGNVEQPEANGTEHEPLRARLEETVRGFVAEPRSRIGVDALALRAQTLVRIGAALRERLSHADDERRRLEATVAEANADGAHLREALVQAAADHQAYAARCARELDELDVTIGALVDEREQLRHELAHIANSTEWRAVSQLKRTLHRHPQLSSPARRLFNRIVRRLA